MLEELNNWFSENYLETIASFLSLVNIYFGIKEKAIFWFFSLIGSSIFIYI